MRVSAWLVYGVAALALPIGALGYGWPWYPSRAFDCRWHPHALQEREKAERDRLSPRPDRGMAFDEAAKRVMHHHRRVFAAPGESERQDREAGVGPASSEPGLAG